jgi:hypothetical protein
MKAPITVTITGFVSMEHAEAWAAWYDGSGEQQSDDWLEECDVPSAYLKGPPIIEENNITLALHDLPRG